MTLRALALVMALTVSNGSVAQDFCAHHDTNGLVWNKAFEAGIRSYFGGQKAYLFWKGATIADQVIAGLGGPPDQLVRLDEDTVLASACRAHSCMEKAAVVIDCPSKVVAVGVVHYCSANKPGCVEQPELTLYLDGRNQLAHRALKEWAAKELGEKSEGMPVRVRSPRQTLPQKG